MRVSLVIPTYQRQAWIGRTLHSVLASTVRPDEIIVIDDGSTDETAAVVGAFGEHVRYVLQANAGVAAARNHGARLARGEWLAFLDSDDLWHPRKLEWQLGVLDAIPEAGWSLTNCTVIDLEDLDIPGRQGFEASFPVFRQQGVDADTFFARHLERRRVAVGDTSLEVFAGDLFEALFLGNVGLPSSTLVRRDLFEALGGFDPAYRLAEETEFYLRLAHRAPVAILMRPLVGYRVGRSGSLISPHNSERLIMNALQSIEKADALRPAPDAEAVARRREGRRRLLDRLAYTRVSNLDGAGARAALREARRSGAPLDLRFASLFGAACLPSPVLRGLHRLKRALA